MFKVAAWNTPLRDPNQFAMSLAVNTQLNSLETQILALPPSHAASDMYQLGLFLLSLLTWKEAPLIEVSNVLTGAGATPGHRLITAAMNNNGMAADQRNYYLYLMMCSNSGLFNPTVNVWAAPFVPLPAIVVTPVIKRMLHYGPNNRPTLEDMLIEFGNFRI